MNQIFRPDSNMGFYSKEVSGLNYNGFLGLGFPETMEYELFKSEEEWLIFRNHSIGSSDIAVISGQSHFSYPKAVFYRLIDNFYPEEYKDFDYGKPVFSTAMNRGKKMEKYILDMYKEEIYDEIEQFDLYHVGQGVFRNKKLIEDIRSFTKQDKVISHTTPDAILEYYDEETKRKELVLLEIKTKGKNSPVSFGKPFTNQVPIDYYLQVQHQLLTVPEAKRAEIVLFDADTCELKRYPIEHDFKYQQTIKENICSFINDYLVPNVVPKLEPTNTKDEEVIFLKKQAKDPKQLELVGAILELRKAKDLANAYKDKISNITERTKQLVFELSLDRNMEKNRSVFIDESWKDVLDLSSVDLKKPIAKVTSTFGTIFDREKILKDFPNLKNQIDLDQDIEKLLESGLLNEDVSFIIQKDYTKKKFKASRLDIAI